MPKTILVSNRLPVKLDERGLATRTAGGLASALAGVGGDTVWVGWPGVAAEALGSQGGALAALPPGLRPVHLPAADVDAYYEGYSNATLWPVLHGMLTRLERQRGWFEAYERVNRAFAAEVLAVAAPGDLVWVHDFHLMLLPSLLREARRGLGVGFFLHTPFPSSQSFRVLPERRALLTGLLGADLLGFHTYGDLRRLRSTLLRVLGVDSDLDAVRREAHTARLGVHPIGHDQAGLAAAVGSAEFRAAVDEVRAQLGGRQLVLGVERLDYTKGIPEKLAAIRRFLTERPDLRRQVVFVLVAVPSRAGVREYDLLTEAVQREVGALNGEFGSLGLVPVQFLHRSFPMAELAALYAVADVCLVTPLIDGMNLVAKEFVACKVSVPEARPGVLILSEFAGAAQELSEALLVNPYDVEGVAVALADALAMDHGERRRRVASMGPRTVRGDAARWASRFLGELQHAVTAARGVAPTGTLRGLAATVVAGVRAGRRLALVLDYDGTLRDFTLDPEDALPGAELREVLAALAACPLVSLVLLSGRSAEFMERALGGLGALLVAEHGYRQRPVGATEWEVAHPGLDLGWMRAVRPILDQAVELTPGTALEEKRTALVWHYRRAEREFGAWRANLLLTELVVATAAMPVVVQHGHKIVEVSAQEVGKGVALRRLVHTLRPEVLVVAGDDETDEAMFSVDLDAGVTRHSIKVGAGPTRAARRTEVEGLRVFLHELLDALRTGA